MADYLVIVESPAKAKTIGKYLGSKYIVKASMGHVRDLPKSQLGVDIDHGFEPKYITIRGKGDVLKELKDSGRKVKSIFLAADPDREGEAIAWHLAQSLDVDPSRPCRVVFNEITKQAVKDAFKHPRAVNMDLVHAQQARRILDRLVGYRISPLLWKKVKRGLSAGRVQSVAVRLVVDREREIRAFTPEEYWTVRAQCNVSGERFVAQFYGYKGKKQELKTHEDVVSLFTRVKGQPFVVDKVRASERKRNPSPPFTTSSLQQEAARRLGFRAQRTMSVAQQLYEGIDLPKEGAVGLITYMRTDSTRLSDTALTEARAQIVAVYGDAYVPDQPRVYSTRQGAQDAHEAIRPTSAMRDPESLKSILSRDQYRLYKLIYERFLACQMASAVLDTLQVEILAGEATFRASGSKIKFPGFMKLYIEGSDDQEEEEGFLPPLQEGQTLEPRPTLKEEQHFTQPPPRFSEARLVKSMEELGIGRPSTYAPTIETIQKRGYVLLQEKRFVPTELGELVIDLLKEFFPTIVDADFTAQLEKQLDDVEDGDVDYVKMLDLFNRDFEQYLEIAEKSMEHVTLEDELSDEICEKCGRQMVFKHGRFGKFLACPGFPECRNAKPILKPLDVACPRCSKPLVQRSGKKRRVFYGCSGYPECNYVLWDEPAMRPCPSCGEPLIKKKNKRGEQIVCSNADCQHVEQSDESVTVGSDGR
ncbi:type I DNA topoisomerase [Ferroacidibacillus organovorans]|uniref:DNA topoisomerase 1 n=1 Tax=Ferroacidibacillus organovorans TaxID=1765683 RepID=A0A162UY84_9BACL|nr:type I DNA topoisomerase [Ferroacidibacillus organovorans]KYP82143.1 DNA topoisomerase I [Ferroacidibacillus organovorans]OAG94426.1 DNA topoisomerase I [Ferroacidibacillus organovorans]OPG15688.1 DNA topoisomerase I [Ferroacidibacillus organovorans]